jgi:hypothetical protein
MKEGNIGVTSDDALQVAGLEWSNGIEMKGYVGRGRLNHFCFENLNKRTKIDHCLQKWSKLC